MLERWARAARSPRPYYRAARTKASSIAQGACALAGPRGRARGASLPQPGLGRAARALARVEAWSDGRERRTALGHAIAQHAPQSWPRADALASCCRRGRRARRRVGRGGAFRRPPAAGCCAAAACARGPPTVASAPVRAALPPHRHAACDTARCSGRRHRAGQRHSVCRGHRPRAQWRRRRRR